MRQSIVIEVSSRQAQLARIKAIGLILAEVVGCACGRWSSKVATIRLLKGKVLLGTEQVAWILRDDNYFLRFLAKFLYKPLTSLVADIMPVLGKNVLTLKRLRARFEKICDIILPYVLFDVYVVREIVVRPEVLFKKSCDPDGQIGAINAVKPRWRVDLGPA